MKHLIDWKKIFPYVKKAVSIIVYTVIIGTFMNGMLHAGESWLSILVSVAALMVVLLAGGK